MLFDELQDGKNGMEEENQEVKIWEEIWFVNEVLHKIHAVQVKFIY